jgi:hypothetical protein
MTNEDVLGLGILGGAVALILIFSILRNRFPAEFRHIEAFRALRKAIERAVEAGERVHLSLGTGSVIGPDSATAFAGLAILTSVARATSMSDRPAVVTTGDGAMAILAQDTLRTAYDEIGASDLYEPTAGRMIGPTPFSYAAGLPLILSTEQVSVHMLIGSFGAEGALAADFGERKDIFVIAGTEDVQSQALLYATASNPLIGEEIFAGGAYLDVGSMHIASLRAQDFLRFVLIVLILAGAILRTVGDFL